jgi:hypothetical protein
MYVVILKEAAKEKKRWYRDNAYTFSCGEYTTIFLKILGHDIAQVVSRRFPTVVAWVQLQVR